MRIFITALMLLSSIGFAQAQRTHLLKLSPQHFAVNTFKVDWEFSSGQNGSWVISPYITARDQYSDSTSWGDKVLGTGIGLNRKVYVAGQTGEALTGLYGMFSGTYNFYKTKYNDYDYTYSGPPNYVTTYVYSQRNQDIHSASLSFSIGYQFTIKKLVYVDTFLGGGIRYSNTSTNDDYYSSFADFAYSGIEPKFGVTVGLKLQ